MVKYYILECVALWSRNLNIKKRCERLEAMEMWFCRRMECVRWNDKVTNETVLKGWRTRGGSQLVNEIKKRKRNWL